MLTPDSIHQPADVVQINALTERIIGAAIEVHKSLGPGLLESIYEEALCHEFTLIGVSFEQQKPVSMIYKDKVIKGQLLDLVVENQIILELKSLSRTPEISQAQILSYLRATGLKKGLLINFGFPRLVDGIQRFSL